MSGYYYYYFDTYILLYKNWQTNICFQLKHYNFELSVASNEKIIKIK